MNHRKHAPPAMQYTTADIVGADYSGQEYHASIHLSDKQSSFSGKTFSLAGSPSVVHGAFSCDHLRISSLKGAPRKVKGCFSLSNCEELRSLHGAPEKVGSMYLADCPVASLVGGPHIVDRYYRISHAPIIGFQGAPQIVGTPGIWSTVTFSNCHKLGSMAGIHHHFTEINGGLYFDNCPEAADFLHLFFIKGLRHFSCSTMPQGAINLFNKHLATLRGKAALLPCQIELITQGFENFAEI